MGGSGAQGYVERSASVRRWGLVLVIALAVAVRVINLDAVGFNSDEAVYAGQAAAIAQVPILTDLFPVFRAHPLLFQFALALVFSQAGAHDWLGRLVSAGFGVATVVVVCYLGLRLYGGSVALIAALFMAIMPYHVIVTRQVLLDGPMTLFSTLSLFALAQLAETGRGAWLYAAAAAMGLTFLAKETGILMVGAIYAFLALSPEVKLRVRDVLLSVVIMAVVMAAFPLSTTLAGGGGGRTTQSYLVWQLFRRANHDWDFYLRIVPPTVGILLMAAAVVGTILLWRENDWREKLLVLWIVIPVAFFQLWPTKGFQYLLPAAPALALLAARSVVRVPARLRSRHSMGSLTSLLLTLVITSSLFASSWARVNPSLGSSFLAGSGGVPGGREAGRWIDDNVPAGATFVTIGPSMANILQYYGHRRALGLSVSPNPLHRNPSYEPVLNLDYQIRTSGVQYLVWDSFSAGRSQYFADRLLHYVEKYRGRAVHTQTIPVTTVSGAVAERPVIIIFEVRP